MELLAERSPRVHEVGSSSPINCQFFFLSKINLQIAQNKIIYVKTVDAGIRPYLKKSYLLIVMF